MILSPVACEILHLPQATQRYTPSRKRRIVEAIRFGIVVRRDMIDTYGLSEPELREWEDKFPPSAAREAA